MCERQLHDFLRGHGNGECTAALGQQTATSSREEWRILATPHAYVDKPAEHPLLLGLCRMDGGKGHLLESQIMRLCTVEVIGGKLYALRDFPLSLHQSFYAHSVGSCSVNAPCPPALVEQVREVLARPDWNGIWENEEEEAE